jgi:uncharacterized protein (DUF433 family)
VLGVLKNKPVLKHGEDPRDLPTYTVPEAALFLAIPDRTMQFWFSDEHGLIKPAGEYGRASLLSFRNLTEAYMLEVLRRVYGFSLRSLRKSLIIAKHETRKDHPLLDADIRVFFNALVLNKPARGRSGRQVLNLSKPGSQLAIPGMVDQLAKRIMFDEKRRPYRIYPWRFMMKDNSRPVAIDPSVLSGRLVVTGTRVPVRTLWKRNLSGETPEELADDYRIGAETVRKALEHIERPVHKAA